MRHRQRINCGHNKRESLLYGSALFEDLRFITAEWEAGIGGAFCEAVNVAVTILGLSGILALAVMAAGGSFAIEQTLYYIAKPIAFISVYFAHYALKDEDSHISYKTHPVICILSMRPPLCRCQAPDDSDAAEGKASYGAAIAEKGADT